MKKSIRPVSLADRPMICPRQFALSLSRDIPRYWVNNDAYTTHMLNAFSCIFPGGERFFVRSVIHFQAKIFDARLRRDIRNFCGQESVHGKQHEDYNEWAKTYGYALDKMTTKFEDVLRKTLDSRSAPFCLALTAALEHITAVMGKALLSSEELLEAFHPSVRPLWIWHAIEEIEHKAVAFEVLMQIDTRYHVRFAAMFLGTIGLAVGTAILMTRLLQHDRQLLNVRSCLRWLHLLYRTGFVKNVLIGLCAYFRPGFHPWQSDDRALLDKFLAEVLTNVYEPGAGTKEMAA